DPLRPVAPPRRCHRRGHRFALGQAAGCATLTWFSLLTRAREPGSRPCGGPGLAACGGRCGSYRQGRADFALGSEECLGVDIEGVPGPAERDIDDLLDARWPPAH